jgi:phospholipid/cholesterol/gamma-HCH transport system permease protein
MIGLDDGSIRMGLNVPDHTAFVSLEMTGENMHAVMRGAWQADQAAALEAALGAIKQQTANAKSLSFDLSNIMHLDTVGAWLIQRTRQEFEAQNRIVKFSAVQPDHNALLEVAAGNPVQPHQPPERVSCRQGIINNLADIGADIINIGKNLAEGIVFLGEIVAAMLRIVRRPSTFRVNAFVHQLEQVALRGVPIIVLISFLVGAIVAQQGIFQLQRFGATPFVVNLVGILVLRELGVLLTSIMVAGRSGSAFTAEIGSMKMREEIDALRVMGLDPIEILIVPRICALIVGLPLLTFLSSMAALIGGGLVAWFYAGINPDIFLARLQSAIQLNTFLVGLIKAPFMAVVIGLIASMEGLAVKGSAESLGRQVTSSVVKAIFMVIVMDGLFAMFFAAINY